MQKITAANIDAYIAAFPENVQLILQQIRETIRQAAPDAQETISYAIPTFTFHGVLIYFAAYKNHIGLYATPQGNIAFAAELSSYKQGKGSVQFPINEPIPYNLIARMVAFKVEENLKKSLKKPQKKK
jgi:uncharacterized protein YdhG (YjbR/CyaY superfamily)